ncbi:hypothetical protein ACIQTT_12490 [Microbacterium sp. NPDC090225]|uniref:hypothetical protein n=1 Tax=Microbacterium sp. NPDC090225 TaxID=3364207 RepID=UPI0037FBA6B7
MKSVRFGVTAGILASLTFGLLGCAGGDPLEGKFVFPIEWAITSTSGVDSTESTRLTLNQDGTAALTDFPVGNWSDESEPGCIEFEGDLVSGDASWEFVSEGKMLITSTEGSFSIFADAGRFGTVSWIDFYLYKCDGTKFSFNVESEIILPTSR